MGECSMDRWKERIVIQKGWSADQKYRVTDKAGVRYFLRLSPPEMARQRHELFLIMRQLDRLQVPMCRPLELGSCEQGVYSLISWIEGRDLEEVLPELSLEKQYQYGFEAGRILTLIHSVPAPEEQEDWCSRFGRKMDRNIRKYRECPLKYEGGHRFLDYMEANRHLLKDRPQCLQHGDYHIGNMMMDDSGKLQIIDFDRFDYGDPWEEFNRIVWCAQSSPRFASGMVDGYFSGPVPREFWELLALYISSNALSSLPWSMQYGPAEVAVMQKQAGEILDWYDGMTRLIPAWYEAKS